MAGGCSGPGAAAPAGAHAERGADGERWGQGGDVRWRRHPSGPCQNPMPTPRVRCKTHAAHANWGVGATLPTRSPAACGNAVTVTPLCCTPPVISRLVATIPSVSLAVPNLPLHVRPARFPTHGRHAPRHSSPRRIRAAPPGLAIFSLPATCPQLCVGLPALPLSLRCPRVRGVRWRPRGAGTPSGTSGEAPATPATCRLSLCPAAGGGRVRERQCERE